MKQNVAGLSLVTTLAVAGSGCQIIGDIFQAGVAAGAILVILVLVGVIWLVTRLIA